MIMFVVLQNNTARPRQSYTQSIYIADSVLGYFM